MPLLSIKTLPREECLLEAAKLHPNLDPSACGAVLTLLRSGDEVFRVIDEHFSSHGLSEGRFTILMLLNSNRRLQGMAGLKSATPASLAEFSGVTRATMTGLIDTLERDGLVLRKPDPEDRRMMNVEITEKGVALMEQVMPVHFSRISQLMAPLSQDERAQLQHLLSKVLTQAGTLGRPVA